LSNTRGFPVDASALALPLSAPLNGMLISCNAKIITSSHRPPFSPTSVSRFPKQSTNYNQRLFIASSSVELLDSECQLLGEAASKAKQLLASGRKPTKDIKAKSETTTLLLAFLVFNV
jgi:hypothetical protein